jgi:hypothetical protein
MWKRRTLQRQTQKTLSKFKWKRHDRAPFQVSSFTTPFQEQQSFTTPCVRFISILEQSFQSSFARVLF